MATLSIKSVIKVTDRFLDLLSNNLPISISKKEREYLFRKIFDLISDLQIEEFTESLNRNDEEVRPKIPGLAEFGLADNSNTEVVYEITRYKLNEENLESKSSVVISELKNHIANENNFYIDEDLGKSLCDLLITTMHEIVVDEGIRPDIPSITYLPPF